MQRENSDQSASDKFGAVFSHPFFAQRIVKLPRKARETAKEKNSLKYRMKELLFLTWLVVG